MIKLLDRAEVLKRVRITNKYYSPSQNLIYKSDKPEHFEDFEIIRYNRQDWAKVLKNRDTYYFVTVKEYKNVKHSGFLLEIAIKVLQHLSDCGYGFLKGCDKDE